MTWIKIRTNLLHDPAVLRIAAATRMNAYEAVGMLVNIWAWADGLTEDGTIPNSTIEDIDAITGRLGFGAAMRAVGWVDFADGRLVLPKWDRHNSASAKRRAMDAERKRQQRTATETGKVPAESGPMSASDADTMRTRGEERREEQDKVERARAEPPLGSETEIQAIEPHWTKETGWTGITPEARQRWALAYPACPIDTQLAQMDAWLRSNPEKARKARWERFVTNWLKREQDRGVRFSRPYTNGKRAAFA